MSRIKSSEMIDCDENRGDIEVLSDVFLADAAHLLVGTNTLQVLAHLQRKRDCSIHGNNIVITDSPGSKGSLSLMTLSPQTPTT